MSGSPVDSWKTKDWHTCLHTYPVILSGSHVCCLAAAASSWPEVFSLACLITSFQVRPQKPWKLRLLSPTPSLGLLVPGQIPASPSFQISTPLPNTVCLYLCWQEGGVSHPSGSGKGLRMFPLSSSDAVSVTRLETDIGLELGCLFFFFFGLWNVNRCFK